MLLSSIELAKHYKVQRSTIYTWIKEGCPIAEQGAQGKSAHMFDSLDVAKWREKRAVQNIIGNAEVLSKEEAQRRKLQAEASLTELELARKRGEVADLTEMQAELSHKFAEVRSAMRKIPERTVLRVVGETDEAKIKAILLQEIDSALQAIADE